MRPLAILAMSLLLSCGRTLPDAARSDVSPQANDSISDPGQAPLGEVPPDNVMTDDPEQLVGTWHTRPTGGYEWRGLDIVLEIGRDRIVATSGCVRQAWTYRFSGMKMEVTPAAILSCKRGLTPDERAFMDAMGAADTAYHRGGRGLIFEGPKGRVVVFEHPR